MREACGPLNDHLEDVGVAFEFLTVLVLPPRMLALGVVLRIERLSDLANVFYGIEEVDQLALRVLLQEAPMARRTVGDANILRLGEVLLGACNLALHTLLELTLAVLGHGGEVDAVLALAVVVAEQKCPDHAFAVVRTVRHRDLGLVEADHDGVDGAAERRHLVLPVLFLGRDDVPPPPLGNVLNAGGGHVPTMVVLKVCLQRAYVELGIPTANLNW